MRCCPAMTDQPSGDRAVIKPFAYDDPITGDHVEITVSPYYSKLTVNKREYYFIRETGEFDGTATPIKEKGPVLISSRE